MDSYALQVANALTGNDPHEAVIELHFPAAVFRFDEPALIALSGADFDAAVDDIQMPVNKSLLVPRGAILSFNKKVSGERCYLSVRGGFSLTPWLGSYSTNLAASAGGLNGKKLTNGDILHFRKKMSNPEGILKIFHWRADTTTAYMDAHYLYFIKGPEWDWLDEASQYKFLQEPFTVTSKSDRMAIWLQGEKLSCVNHDELVSSAVTMGTMQLLPTGELLVLMADHQTTGGYPRIGNVITSHLPKLAQASPCDYIHMLQVEQQTAEELLFSQYEELKILHLGCQFKLEKVLKTYEQIT